MAPTNPLHAEARVAWKLKVASFAKTNIRELFQMKILHAFSIVAHLFCGGLFCLAAPEPDKPIPVRVASYNVEFSKSATPEQVGEMFKPYKLDIIGFDEAPDGDWTARVGKVLARIIQSCRI